MSKPKLSVIDADGLIFRAAYSYRENTTLLAASQVCKEIDDRLGALLNITRAEYYIGFYGLEGKKNFRYDVATVQPYKGKREKEAWYYYFEPIVKKHFKEKWGFVGVGDIEADDCLSITFHKFKDDYNITLVYEDKDLHQIPNHRQYNFAKRKFKSYSEKEANYNLWYQVIAGDSSDNVPGLFGKGPKFAANTLSECETYQEMFEATKLAYFEYYGTWEKVKEQMVEQFLLVHMLEKPKFDYPENINLKTWNSTKKNPKEILLDI